MHSSLMQVIITKNCNRGIKKLDWNENDDGNLLNVAIPNIFFDLKKVIQPENTFTALTSFELTIITKLVEISFIDRSQ